MLVIVVDTDRITGDELPWIGRRHDDDGPESTGEATAQGLFDAVFAALHDGEQVAIGFDCPLTAPASQLDSDEAGPGWMWGDAGRLYFCIRQEDFAAQRFDAVWCDQQCY